MDLESLWEKFAETGSVSDYLEYCAAKGEIDDNN